MRATDRLAEIEARSKTERILRDGDPYYATEAGAWGRNSADLDAADALVAALRAVLDLTRAWQPANMPRAIRDAIDAALDGAK